MAEIREVAESVLLGFVIGLTLIVLTGSVEWHPAQGDGPWRIGCEVRAGE